MKKLLLGFIASFAFFATLSYLGIRWDLLVNPWLKEAVLNWKWYNYFTSHHGLPVLYLTHGWWWLVVPTLPAAILALVFWAHDE